MDLLVTRAALETMRAAARDCAPEECCGLLLGHEAVEQAVPARNIAADPRHRFEIDPRALVDAQRHARAEGPPLLGYYHSHPAGRAEPSATDRAMAPGDGRIWAIIGTNGVTFWRDDQEGLVSLSYTIEDR